LRVCLLASGSKGNSLFIDAGKTKFLIDAGLSAREILHRLASIGIEGPELNAIFISHEHTDHTRGAGTLARRLRIPVFISYAAQSQSRETFKRNEVVNFESGCSFMFRDLLIDPFPITHDCSDPVGFTIETPQGRIGVATDLGIATRLVKEKLKDSRVLVLESNHDEDMLFNGPYPWHLKQRIKSRHGHLSNSESVELLYELVNPSLEGVFLAHLSEVNNDPAIASNAFRRLLDGQNVCRPQLIVGTQYSASDVMRV
jgi:phosphoribosyl 1,2-cyclic phosphodiesterase